MADLELENVRLEIEDGLAVLTLDDPQRLNAITAAMATSMMRALQECAKPRHGVRALYLTGEGRGFCAGVNIAGRGSEGNANLPVLLPADGIYHPLIRKLRGFDRPIIIGVNGACVGIGLAMALQADYVIASQDAYFSAPFAKLGSGPDCGLTWGLPRVIGPGRARHMLLRAEKVSAPVMEQWGLVSELLPADGFAAQARATAAALAVGPTVALSEMRRLLQDSPDRAFEAQLEAESRALVRTFRSKDNRIGMQAFATKSQPVFIGE
ncbi:enoyl-CoA hydratase-related protein [Sphingomonas sp. 37zxx]|uniref:enoyl-CoA hydratase-related protein n=1 Tax=Sphingomonas sp. 37zxx TaxID=1550073 RepID=UPI00053C0203|nr:enoyl-CoA hydratase-related protein [Sphingomonas sp. 37zxx]